MQNQVQIFMPNLNRATHPTKVQRSFYIIWGTDFYNNFLLFKKNKETEGIFLACG